MNKLAWFVSVVAVAAGVGCDDNRNVAVSNTNPLGTVGGRVLDVNGETALVGAAVTLEEAGTTVMMTMTDATGAYSFAKVPAGSFFLTIAAGGYEGAYVPGVLSGAVGNFPVSNPQTTMPTVEMFKTDGAFTVALVDDRGAPVGSVALTARPQVKFFAYDYPYTGGTPIPVLIPFGQYAVTATSDANGQATFMGLPNAAAFNLVTNTNQMIIDVPPVVVMGSTTYQYLGESVGIDPTRVSLPFGQNVFTIQLAGTTTPLGVLSSTVSSLVNGTVTPTGAVVPVGQPISVTFNQAVDPKSLRAQLLDENGVSLGNMTATFAAGNIVSLAPASPFTAAKRYNLVLAASPANRATGSFSATAPFFTAGPAALTVTAAIVAAPMSPMPTVGRVVQLTFSEAVGLGRGTGAVALTCVAWYEGIDLDNSGGTVSYQGEYGTPLQTCPNAVNPPVGGLDVTRIVSMEPTTGMPMTGFANKWWVQLDDVTVTPSTTMTGCKNTVAAACTKPASGTMVHLIFSHLPATQTVTRADGTVVGDLMVAIQ
jgi:hypothetical protein